ncbi:hypothetical protein DB88DRAFT_128327 [Papiliotrema laurentii]|uniref:BZIP domain-containing protein n=1 Tax=Papiliotrema laurentii TaxID=5418 RepID=A0AAD9FIL8_PAPLA|nr:hypothetical protein DB88DRAFT_128327 [Papiliotrema laurentii]
MPFGKSAINPDFLQQPPAVLISRDDLGRGSQMDEDYPAEFPPSPIRSLSESESPLPMVRETFTSNIKSRLRSTSEGDHFNKDNKNKDHKRKMTWTLGMAFEGLNISQAQKERDLMELGRLEQGGPTTRRERRRLQNRLAQRAFRARSKVQNAEAAARLTDLEQLVEMQADQLRQMNEALEKLQRENAALEAQSSAKAYAERAHYNKDAP